MSNATIEVESRILSPEEFYRDPAVRQRLAEYCGGDASDIGSLTAESLSGMSETYYPDRYTEQFYLSTPLRSFFQLLKEGVDVFRSVLDRTSTLGVLDIEYFNTLYPGEAYFNSELVFRELEPIYTGLLKIFKRFGIEVLPIMTGQGYHFSFRVDHADPVHREMAALGKLGKTIKGKYDHTGEYLKPRIPLEQGKAFDGMGRLMEYVSHLLIRGLGRGYTGIPVVCTDVALARSREAVSLDLSMYGDPVHTRDVRCPFSMYRKHKISKGKFGLRAAQEIPILVTLPRTDDVTLGELLKIRRDFTASRDFARHVETKIPENSQGVKRLIKSYRSSALFRFHRHFDAAEHDDSRDWCRTYDRFDPAVLPPCVANSLYHPNDNLLKPTNLHALTRVLLGMGWHPKHIAGLVRSKWERDYGWGTQWLKYDAATRADFYIRLFAGLLCTGIDQEEDLNCRVHNEKGYCVQPGCGWDLSEYRVPPLKAKPRKKL